MEREGDRKADSLKGTVVLDISSSKKLVICASCWKCVLMVEERSRYLYLSMGDDDEDKGTSLVKATLTYNLVRSVTFLKSL